MSPPVKVKTDNVNSTQICVPVCASKINQLRQAINRARPLADIFELRLDCLDGAELNLLATALDSIVSKANKPVILTLRNRAQGGKNYLTDLRRHAFWLKYLAPEKHGAAFADVELDSALLFRQWEQEGKVKIDWDRVICSHHDFETVPAADLETIYGQMKEMPAGVLKIAVNTREVPDCLPVFKILKRAKSEGKRIIPVAMGGAGIPTRVLGPSRGAFLTFGSLDRSEATAPGQITATELSEVYRIHNINERTEIFGVVGSPVAHSVSPQINNAAFAALGMNAVYLPLEVFDVGYFIRRMVRPATSEMDWDLRGLSVTAPHKTAVTKELDWLEPSAGEIGAVNTVVIEDGFLRGYNTDAPAALAPLKDLIEIRGARIAVIGVGGAARALLRGLRDNGASVTVFYNRLDRAVPVARKFGADLMPLTGALFNGFDLVINATPLGTRGILGKETPATAEQLSGAGLVYDLVYNPAETPLLREAISAGCETIGGLAMLVAQAAEQIRLWTGRQAPPEIMKNAARHALKKEAGISPGDGQETSKK